MEEVESNIGWPWIVEIYKMENGHGDDDKKVFKLRLCIYRWSARSRSDPLPNLFVHTPAGFSLPRWKQN